MISDSEIIRGIREGDVRQFESLFRSSYVSLVKYAKAIIKDHDTSEEIVQDLFFRLWKDRERLSVKSSLNGYLFRAVHNRCIHHIKHEKVVVRYTEEMQHLKSSSPEIASDILICKDLQSTIARTLEKLPGKAGRIFCMSRFEGLKYSEIAEKLSVSVKTVESNMGKALREFRKILAEQ